MDIGVLTEDAALCRFLCLELRAAGWLAEPVPDLTAGAALYLCDLDTCEKELPENTVGFSYDARKCSRVRQFLLRPIDTAELQNAVRQHFPDTAQSLHPVLRLDRTTRIVRGETGSVRLSQKETVLLSALANGGTLSRESGAQLFGGGESNALDVYVHYLRRKLKSVCRADPVLAVRGAGYRLSPDLLLQIS